MSVDVILKLEVICVLNYQLLTVLFIHSFNSIKHILSHVFISVFLKYIPWKLLLIISLNVDKMTEFSSCATLRTMIIFARNCSVVSYIYQGLFTLSFYLILNLLLLLQLFVVGAFKFCNHRFDCRNVILMLEFQLNHRNIFKLITIKRNLSFD